jgi:prepilin-type N-terminal cleavage/methylation domain-containing protein
MLLIGNRKQTGFTLIEIMVVILVIALVTGMSVLAVNQAGERRFSNEAEKLSIWLNQLSEYSLMQGAAYGIVGESVGKSKRIATLRATIYYRNRWVAVSFPEPFTLGDTTKIEWLMDDLEEKPFLYQQAPRPSLKDKDEEKVDANLAEDKEDFLQPEISFLPDGYVQPQGRIELSFENSEKAYSFFWDKESSRILMESKKQ